MELTFCAPALFGLEGLIADELRFHGKLERVQASNGKVYFSGDENTLIWSNLWLRTAERVLIRLGTFPARSFEELFEGTRELPWERFIDRDGMFPVKGHSLNSLLHSVPTCQKIVKKAVVERLSQHYGIHWFEESGVKTQIQFSIQNDQAELFLDTSGAGLHKRGYRENASIAPLRETLAAGLVKIARYRGGTDFLDPFCGSGTIAIEAALQARNQAPGLRRTFDAERWPWIPSTSWQQAREQAVAAIRHDKFPIEASDWDEGCVRLTQSNAKKAGVDGTVTVRQADATRLELSHRSGVLIANPPYGERLLDQQRARELMQRFGRVVFSSPMSLYLLSSDTEFEHYLGLTADKKRKLYNGMIPCQLFMAYKPWQQRRRPGADRGGAGNCKRTVNTAKFKENKRYSKDDG